jgi:uncharacterized protein
LPYQHTAWFDHPLGIDDLVDIYLRALVAPGLDGLVNAAAPEPVHNSEYAEALARVLHRPAVLPVSRIAPNILFGREGAVAVALASQRMVPAKLTGAGDRFRHPDLESALRHLLGRTRTK